MTPNPMTAMRRTFRAIELSFCSPSTAWPIWPGIDTVSQLVSTRNTAPAAYHQR